MANQRIEHIEYPFVFTDQGNRYNISELKGTPRVGSGLSDDLTVTAGDGDPDCVNGVCPVK